MVDDIIARQKMPMGRRLPDFSPQALELLHASCLSAHKQVQQYLSNPSANALQDLQHAVDGIHNTLLLLGKHGASLVSGEWQKLLHAIAEQTIEDEQASAHTLLLTSGKLADYVAHLRKPGSIDSSIPLLPVVNSCRAARGDTLLSEVLVVASGIQLPRASHLTPPGDVDLLGFTQLLGESRLPLMQALLAWFRNDDTLQQSLQSLHTLFSRLAQSCDAPTTLQTLVPTFESAAFICYSLLHDGLGNDAAVRRLFAQLERALNSTEALQNASIEKDFTRLIPDELVSNLLYYVALSTSSTPKAVALRRRFRLDRYIDRGATADRPGATFDGVGDRLADSIRDSLDAEIDVARQWAAQASRDENHPDYLRLCNRMTQLEPALQLLNANKALNYLRILIALLNDHSANAEEANAKRVRLAELLLRLEHAIDIELAVVDNGARIVSVSAAQANQQACLDEAQRRLLYVEDYMLQYFNSVESETQNELLFQPNELQTALDELALVDSALQVLPLPEVSPLIQGVHRFIEAHRGKALLAAQKSDLATILVSLGYYLKSVFDASGTAGQLLLDAESALINLQDNHNSQAQTITESNKPAVSSSLPFLSDEDLDATIVEANTDDQEQQFVMRALQSLSAVSVAQANLAQAQSSDATNTAINQLHTEYVSLSTTAEEYNAQDILKLSKANERVLSQANDALSTESSMLISESVAVLPQLINQWPSSEQVNGFNELLQALDAAARVEAHQARFAEPSTSKQPDTAGDDRIGLDNTLEHVFYKECEAHLATLSAAVTTALASLNWGERSRNRDQSDTVYTPEGVQSIDPAVALPSRDMIRALHTLTGSAQTVNAQGIVEISQPLQKAVLIKQRNNDSFNRQETQYIESLVSALKEELALLKDGAEISDAALSVKQALPEFVAGIQSWVSGSNVANVLSAEPQNDQSEQASRVGQTIQNTHVRSANTADISSVFDEEARELLGNMREASKGINSGSNELTTATLRSILADLHTLKGSARMAGQLALADKAHELEAQLQQIEQSQSHLSSEQEREQLLTVVTTGLASIQSLLLEAPTAKASASKEATTGISEAAFARMLSLASKASVAQAQLGDSLLQLKQVCRDVETTSERLQNLPQHANGLDSAAANEMRSDLSKAHQLLAELLHTAESYQSSSSRANASLQQSLIRAQLVQLAELEPRLRLAAQDMSAAEEKRLNFSMEGGELTIDRALFRQLQAPLEHLVRNAVVHGIESVSERLACGKTAEGHVKITVNIDGTDLLISVQDDGAGIDMEAINARLQQESQATVTNVDELRAVLCESGFSTVENANQLAGRGLGLASVSHTLNEIGGQLQLTTHKDKGTRFTLRVPQQVVVNQVILVESDNVKYAIPVNYVQSVCEDTNAGAFADIQFNGQDYLCQSLQELLQPQTSNHYRVIEPSTSPHRILVIAQDRHIAICVDKVIGYREVIAQPLGHQLAALKRYLGGCVLSDGTPVLITDLNRLLDPARSTIQLKLNSDSFLSTARLEQPTRTALVVDDSITMRVAAEQMLETLGFVPILARDGEEALTVLSNKRPDVMLVDIDMPRINGFDLLRRLQTLYPQHNLPIIMISTREGKEDRALAFELGAKQYLQKPYLHNTLKRALQEVGFSQL